MTRIAIVIYPGFTQLDATGPFEVFHRAPGAQVDMVAASLDPVRADSGLRIVPDTTFAECEAADVLCVPGGPGQNEHMLDEELLTFLRRLAVDARYVTSVCTGSLLLGAAGLLEGYRATSHWSARDELSLFGAIPTEGRVVRDRNRFSGGGVTAGIDFALTVVAEIWSEPVARAIQLLLEYAPAPPFDGGTPETTPDEIRARLQERTGERWAHRQATNRRAAERWKHWRTEMAH